MRSLVFDHDEHACMQLRMYLPHESTWEAPTICESTADAVRLLRERTFDVAFVRTSAGDRGVAATLLQLSTHVPLFVGLARTHQDAVHAFRCGAIDCLIKPLPPEAVRLCTFRIEREWALARMASRQAPGMPEVPRFASRLPVEGEGRLTILVKTSDVRWIEAEGGAVTMHLRDADRRSCFSLELLQRYLDPDRFLRVHRKALVNVDCIRGIRPWVAGSRSIVLDDGKELRVGRTFATRLTSWAKFR